MRSWELEILEEDHDVRQFTWQLSWKIAVTNNTASQLGKKHGCAKQKMSKWNGISKVRCCARCFFRTSRRFQGRGKSGSLPPVVFTMLSARVTMTMASVRANYGDKLATPVSFSAPNLFYPLDIASSLELRHVLASCRGNSATTSCRSILFFVILLSFKKTKLKLWILINDYDIWCAPVNFCVKIWPYVTCVKREDISE
jgi:hypothetical protein